MYTHHQTHSQGSLSAAQLAQLSQYDRVGTHAPSSSSIGGGYLRQRTQTPPTDMPGGFGSSGGMAGVGLAERDRDRSSIGGGGVLRSYASNALNSVSNAFSSASAGHGHLVSLKPASPTLSTAMVLAGAPVSPPPPPQQQAHLMQLVPAAPKQPSPPPPPQQQQPPPIIATAVPTPTTSSTTTTTTVTTGAPAMSVSPTITATPSPIPTSILLHIPLIPTPFRVALPPPGAPYVLTEKINALLSNIQIQDRISNALSVPKPNGWILVERVSAEYLQLRDLLGAIREGRLMTEGVVPWVCAGELVEGGVGYWCLGVCT